MTMKSEDGAVCESCTIRINDGVAVATYQWEGNPTQGCDQHDEDVSEWSDDEIREIIGGLIGITEGWEKIDVVW